MIAETPDIRLGVGTLISDYARCIVNYANMMPKRANAVSVTAPHVVYHCGVCFAICSMIIRDDDIDLCMSCSRCVGQGNADERLLSAESLDQLHTRAETYRHAMRYSFIYMYLVHIVRYNSNDYASCCSICNTYVRSDVYEWSNPHRRGDNGKIILSTSRTNIAICKRCGLHAISRAVILRDACTQLIFHSRIIGASIHHDLHLAIHEYTMALIGVNAVASTTAIV